MSDQRRSMDPKFSVRVFRKGEPITVSWLHNRCHGISQMRVASVHLRGWMKLDFFMRIAKQTMVLQ